MKEILVRVRLCAQHIAAAVAALQFWGDHLHEEARRESDKSKADEIRKEAETAFAARKSLWTQFQGEEVSGSTWATGRANAASASVHEGNTKLVPWLMIMALFSGFGMAASLFGLLRTQQQNDVVSLMQNEMARMRVHIMSNDALLLREGVMKPGDQYWGPEGNIEYGRKDQRSH